MQGTDRRRRTQQLGILRARSALRGLAGNSGQEEEMRQGMPGDTGKQLGESGGGPMGRLRLELRERLQARRGERALKRVLAARAKATGAQRRDRRYRGGGMRPTPVTEPAPERAQRSQPLSQEQPDPLARKQVPRRAEAPGRRL